MRVTHVQPTAVRGEPSKSVPLQGGEHPLNRFSTRFSFCHRLLAFASNSRLTFGVAFARQNALADDTSSGVTAAKRSMSASVHAGNGPSLANGLNLGAGFLATAAPSWRLHPSAGMF